MGERVRSRNVNTRQPTVGSKTKSLRRKLPCPRGRRESDFIKWALKMTGLVVAEYLARSRKPLKKPRSAWDLHVIIKDIYQRHHEGAIILEYLPQDDAFKGGPLFLGAIFRRKGAGPRILLNPSQDKLGYRLGLTQESFQALLDHKCLRSKKLFEAIEDLLAFRNDNELTRRKTSTLGEIIAEIAAMEALFPYCDRLKAISSKRRSKLSNPSIRKLAKTYGIPDIWIRYYLRPEIMKQLKKYHQTQKDKR